jgi:hypothetical protein
VSKEWEREAAETKKEHDIEAKTEAETLANIAKHETKREADEKESEEEINEKQPVRGLFLRRSANPPRSELLEQYFVVYIPGENEQEVLERQERWKNGPGKLTYQDPDTVTE